MVSTAEYTRKQQKMARATLDRFGVKLFRAQIASVYSDGKVELRREENRTPSGWPSDGVPSVVLNGSRRFKVGEYAWCLQAHGHSFVLGRILANGERYLDDAALSTELTSLGNTVTKNRLDINTRVDGVDAAKYNKTGGVLSGDLEVKKPQPNLTLRREDNTQAMNIRFQNAGGPLEAVIRMDNEIGGALEIRSGLGDSISDLPVVLAFDASGQMKLGGRVINTGNYVIEAARMLRDISVGAAGARSYTYADLGRSPWGVDGIWTTPSKAAHRQLGYLHAEDPAAGGGGNVYIAFVNSNTVRLENNRDEQATCQVRVY